MMYFYLILNQKLKIIPNYLSVCNIKQLINANFFFKIKNGEIITYNNKHNHEENELKTIKEELRKDKKGN